MKQNPQAPDVVKQLRAAKAIRTRGPRRREIQEGEATITVTLSPRGHLSILGARHAG
jgi:hypothetical protein